MFRRIALYCFIEIMGLIFVNGLYPTTKSAACVPQTIPTTTEQTTASAALRCWSGYGFFTDCRGAIRTPAELAKCEEENRELAKFAFKVKQCPSGHTECYNSYYACGDGRYSLDHGCALPKYATCRKQGTITCLNGKPIELNCEQCKGSLCNIKNVTYSYGTRSTTTPTTTTIVPPGRIRCYYGRSGVGDNCGGAITQSQEALVKCVAQEEQKQNFTFGVETCESGVTQCYDIYHNCRFIDLKGVIHVRGCLTNKYKEDKEFCNNEQAAVCSRGYPDRNKCWRCDGDLCNKNSKKYY